MRGSRGFWKLAMLCLLGVGAVSARAAGGYTLTCEPQRGDSFTIVLTGFEFKVTRATEAATGAAAGKRAEFELSIRFALNKDYEALVSMAEDNEIMRSCKLTDSDVSGGMPTSENVTGKGKNAKVKSPASSSSGGFEWIMSNASITSISAIGSENASGAPEGSVQATIEAQKYTFTK